MQDKLPEYLRGADPKKFGKPKPKIRGCGKKRTSRMPKKDRESTVQREVVKLAAAMRIPLWRQQAGQVMIGRSYMKLAPTGAADLTGYIPGCGIRIEVECKRRDGKGRWSKDQQEWAKQCRKNGVIYMVVKDSEEFYKNILKILDRLKKCSIIDTVELKRLVMEIE